MPSKKSERRLVEEAHANILHLDPNAAKNLDLDLYNQRVTKNGSVSFKTRFSAKFPEAKGLSSQKVSNRKLAFEQALHLRDIVRSHARSPHDRGRETLARVFSRG